MFNICIFVYVNSGTCICISITLCLVIVHRDYAVQIGNLFIIIDREYFTRTI